MAKKQQFKKPLLKELNDQERNILLPKLIFFFEKHTSTLRPATGEKICEEFEKRKEKFGYTVAFNEQRLMKLVNYIRANELCFVLSDNDGYWHSTDQSEIEDCIERLEQRIASQKAAIDGLKRKLKERLTELEGADPFGITDWK